MATIVWVSWTTNPFGQITDDFGLENLESGWDPRTHVSRVEPRRIQPLAIVAGSDRRQ